MAIYVFILIREGEKPITLVFVSGLVKKTKILKNTKVSSQ